MNLNITGDPGTHNSYSEVNIHIDHVENFNPAATSVVNNYGSLPIAPRSHRSEYKEGAPVPSPDAISVLNDEILSYVRRLTRCVAPSHIATYDKLWLDILTLPEVAAEVYNPGKQHGTAFNRNLVAGIICMMKDTGIITETNVSRLAELLEGDKEHSVRAALASPPSRAIYNKVSGYLQNTLKTSP